MCVYPTICILKFVLIKHVYYWAYEPLRSLELAGSLLGIPPFHLFIHRNLPSFSPHITSLGLFLGMCNIIFFFFFRSRTGCPTSRDSGTRVCRIDKKKFNQRAAHTLNVMYMQNYSSYFRLDIVYSIGLWEVRLKKAETPSLRVSGLMGLE